MEIHSLLRSWDFIVIVIYVVSVISLGMWVSFRKKASQDLFLAGRSLGWPNVGFSIWATNMGPWNLLGMCGIAYATGIVTASFDWMVWLCLMLLAMLFAPYYLYTRVTTMPEFIKRRFGNSCHVFLSWYALVGNMVVWLGGTMYAGGILISQIMNWPFWLSLVVLTAIAVSFTMTGGLLAVAITDTFQAVLIIAVSIVLNIVLLKDVGGFHNLIEGTPDIYWKLFRPTTDPEFPAHVIILGVLTGGVWFWCTTQTVVQRVLGARDLRQGQLGVVFTSFLKILPPLLFMLPGIMGFVLHPNLKNPDVAYMTLVTNHLPVGLVGFVIAIIIAALISTVDSALNSFSAIFSLDIYVKNFRPNATDKEKRLIGQIVTVCGGVLVIFVCLWFKTFSQDLFNLIQGLISFYAPPITAVFLIGVLWKRATSKAAFWGLLLGSIVSLSIGVCYFKKIPREAFWPHYLLLAFILFVGVSIFIVILSLLTEKSHEEEELPTIRETYIKQAKKPKQIWILWAILAVVMGVIYIIFN